VDTISAVKMIKKEARRSNEGIMGRVIGLLKWAIYEYVHMSKCTWLFHLQYHAKVHKLQMFSLFKIL
jgi:hypothetical protein